MMFKVLLVGLLATTAFAASTGGQGDNRKGNRADGNRADGNRGDENRGDRSGSDSGGDSGEEVLHQEEFQTLLTDLKDHFLDAAGNVEAMNALAKEANDLAVNGDYSLWDEHRDNFDAMFEEQAEDFENAEGKLWDIASRLYQNPGNFGQSHTCVNLSLTVDMYSDAEGNFVFDDDSAYKALEAMQQDIQCFHSIYEEANDIPDDTSNWPVEYVFDVVAEIYKRVFRVKTAAMRFHKAAQAIGEAEAAIDALKREERTLLKRLLKLLGN